MFRALSSFLGQRYNIFHRNPNSVNISQHAPNVNLQRFAADGGWRVVYYEGGATSSFGDSDFSDSFLTWIVDHGFSDATEVGDFLRAPKKQRNLWRQKIKILNLQSEVCAYGMSMGERLFVVRLRKTNHHSNINLILKHLCG